MSQVRVLSGVPVLVLDTINRNQSRSYFLASKTFFAGEATAHCLCPVGLVSFLWIYILVFDIWFSFVNDILRHIDTGCKDREGFV